MRSNSATGRRHPAEKAFERRHDLAIGFFRADGEAQRIRQPIALEPTQDQPSARQIGVRLPRGLARLGGEMDEEEIADARRDRKPERADLRGEPGKPAIVMRERRRDMGVIGDRRGAGRERGPVDVEGAADAVQGVDDMRRPVEPADAQIGEAEDFEKVRVMTTLSLVETSSRPEA